MRTFQQRLLWQQKDLRGKHLALSSATQTRCQRRSHAHLIVLGIALFGNALMTSGAQENGDTWVHLGALSYHANRDKQYNENNGGLGVEYRFNHAHSLMIGRYDNSYFHRSNYALWGWTPIEVEYVNLMVVRIPRARFGFLIGGVDGYERNNGHFAPVLLPVLSLEWRQFGVNLSAFPSVAGVDGGIAIQLKARFEEHSGRRQFTPLRLHESIRE